MNLTSKQSELVNMLADALPNLPEETAQKNVDWYKEWIKKEPVVIKDRRWETVGQEKILFEVHAPAGDNLYPPSQVPAIWKRVFLEEWPE